MSKVVELTYDLRVVALELIDEPDLAMRQTFDEEKMEELAASIAVHGVIQSLALIENGERMTIAAGHRRYLGATMARIKFVPARVYPAGTDPESIKVHENAFREDVNPAEEAIYYKSLLDTRCEGDVDRLASLVERKRSFVEQRLGLILGYPEVFEALKTNTITMAVAQELNRYKDHGWMLTHLEAAVTGGVKASLVRQWRTETERNVNLLADVPADSEALPGSQAAPPPVMACVVCSGAKDPYNLDFVYIHRGGPCKDLLDRFLSNIGGS